jgi:RNA polymerase sigma-70 factor (ECF subfamily)
VAESLGTFSLSGSPTIVVRYPSGSMNDDEVREVALSYQKQIWNAALRQARNRAEAEDFFQETYRRAFESAGQLRGLAHCRAWLLRILTSLVIDTRRRQRRSPILELVDRHGDAVSASPLEPSGNFEVEILDRLSAQEIGRLIEALPCEQREALTLCDVEGASYQEIAEILDCPIGTVRSRIARARAVLIERLRDHAQLRGIGGRQ